MQRRPVLQRNGAPFALLHWAKHGGGLARNVVLPPRLAMIKPLTGADSTFRARVAVSAPDCGGHVRPVLIEPRHGFWPVRAALEGRDCRVFERLLPEPVGGVVD